MLKTDQAINFNAAAQPDYLALPYHTCNISCDVLKLKLYIFEKLFFYVVLMVFPEM